MDNAKNFAKATVSTGYNSTDTSIVLTTGHGAKLPTAPFNLVWWNSTDYPDPSDDPNVEIVRCTVVATDTLTITRAQEGTTASTKNTASKTYKMIAGLTAKVVNSDIVPVIDTQYGYVTGSDRNANVAIGSANDIRIAAFFLPVPITFSQLGFAVSTADAGASVYDIGIYTANFGGTGTLLANTGGHTLTTTGWKAFTITQGTVTLNPGWYLHAVTGQAATAVWIASTGPGMTPMGIATGTSTSASGGVLPSSIVVPAINWANGWTASSPLFALVT